MIVVRVVGGMGNQLFQYATGRNLAHENKARLYLDIRNLGENTPTSLATRQFGLNAFRASLNFASDRLINRFHQQKPTWLFKSEYKTEKEKYYSYNPQVLKLKGNIYLNGYWQSEKYFAAIRPLLLKEISLRKRPSNTYTKYAAMIKDLNSTSIHIRRGDFVSNKSTKKFHGVCQKEYYFRALDIISQNARLHARSFIFSDDIEWCKKVFVGSDFVFVNGTSDAEDIILMSQCKNNIIANSSFSWWGAWLNNNVEKVVICPKNWVKSRSINTKDIYPKDWIKI